MEIKSLNMIACVDENFAIGKDGELIAYLPKDLIHFRDITSGNFIIFGRKTFLGFPNQKPLKNRINILISSKIDSVEKESDYFYKVNGLENTLNLLKTLNGDLVLNGIKQNPDVFVCGGENVYNDFLFLTKKIYLTIINKDLKGDRFFPKAFLEDFELSSKSQLINENDLSFSFNEYLRK